ncbi:phosphatase PAP2 family protein [Arthrobacter burdickii]|uniref:Phosphatase PAP2 family protein n=1 Tax=Arthrobacter burdickii TaxID=3035920 RepID=A0ABT8K130_9MICC|nr:phosphatase PAP2 family protein [Arthrobacter burdickii]MDN4611121.1 phosphatase PAP2 family protein [Arthrobacter burdickii]
MKAHWILHGKLVVEERQVSARTRKMLYIAAVVLVLAGSGFFFLTLTDVLQKDDLATLDEPVNSWFVGHRIAAVTVVMVVLATVFGPVVLPIVVVMVTAVWIVKARHIWRPLLLAGAMTAGVVLAEVITHLVGRARPPASAMLLGSDSTYSFPSGHVLGASDFLLVGAFIVFSRRRRPGPVLAGFLAAWGGIAAQVVSRLYLGYHWLTDALASIALSLVVLGVVIALDTWRTAGTPEEPRAGPGP